MAIENHNRLDKILHTEEFTSMECGSLGPVRVLVPNGSLNGQLYANKVDDQGAVVMEEKYCGPDCPTLIAKHKAS